MNTKKLLEPTSSILLTALTLGTLYGCQSTEKRQANKSYYHKESNTPKGYTHDELKSVKAIDTHAHLWTEEYLNMLKKAGSDETDVARDLGAYIDDDQLERRLHMMDEAGVQMQVLSATPQSPEYGTESEAVESARYINNLYAELMEKYPDRFIAYMVLPLPYVEASIKEFRRNVNRPGFKGVAMNTLIRKEISPADDRFEALYEELNKAQTVVYIHPTGCGAGSHMVDDYDLTWVVGAPIEDMLVPLQLLKKGIPKKFPRITFHLAHLGGGLAFHMQRIEDNYRDWKAFEDSPKETFSRFYFDAANFYSKALELSVNTYGDTQHMMGSDFPYFQNEMYIRAVTYILDSELSDEDKVRILRDNAAKLYNLK